MRRYWKYLMYVVRHKWFVMMACFRHGLIWRGLTHDLSKFRPSEFIPYAKHFYAPNGGPAIQYNGNGYSKDEDEKQDLNFDKAWLSHIHRQPHHHQHWRLFQDDGTVKVLDMPEQYIGEMVCDWIGAGKAQGYGDNTKNWYEHNKEKIVVSAKTRIRLEELLDAWCEKKNG